MDPSSRIAKFFDIVFWPVTKLLAWLFEHRCTFNPGEVHCSNEYCSVGKHGVVGWGQTNERWVRRNPMPTTAPKAPPPPKWAERLHTEQVDDMLLEAWLRTQRVYRVPPARRGDTWPWLYKYRDGYTTNVALVKKEYKRQ